RNKSSSQVNSRIRKLERVTRWGLGRTSIEVGEPGQLIESSGVKVGISHQFRFPKRQMIMNAIFPHLQIPPCQASAYGGYGVGVRGC
ncbi:hypothetical protein JAAARDRAFT_39986, partial [Jaapia argillacea MUCL 33604]